MNDKGLNLIILVLYRWKVARLNGFMFRLDVDIFFLVHFRFVFIVRRPNLAFFIEDIAVRCVNKLFAPGATQK